MKAVAVFPAQHELRLIDEEITRDLAPGSVRLRTIDVGVCGTDREITAFEYGTPPGGSPHLVIGHECVAEVMEVGADVRRVAVGDLVVPMVRRPCRSPQCTACRAGRQDFCFTGDFVEKGIKEAHGFMCESFVDEGEYLHLVPPALRDVAVLVEPLTIAEKALQQIWQVQQRLPWECPGVTEEAPGRCHSAVVLGAGPVGLLGAMALVHAGFRTFVYSREPVPNAKAALAAAFGATYISSTTCSPEQLAEKLEGIDVVYEAAGASRVAFEVMRVLGVNGVFVFTGVPGRKAPIEVDTDRLMRSMVLKNQVVLGTVNAGRESYQAAVRDLEVFVGRWPEQVRALITARYPVDAYRDLLLGPRGGIKQVIRFGGQA